VKLLGANLLPRILFITMASFVGTELLTGSTPVFSLHRALFSPTLFIVIALYGTGVLLVREASVVFKKGWLSILMFGAAYSVIEEGIFAKTWFASSAPSYGSWGGVNWTFGIAETIVETIFSIAIPIGLSRIAFPESVAVRWFGNKSTLFIIVLYLGLVGLGFCVSFQDYTQPLAQIPLALVLAGTLILIGYSLKSPVEEDTKTRQGVAASPQLLAIRYFFVTLIVFMIAPVWLTPETPHLLPPLISNVIAVFLVFLNFRFLHRSPLSSQQLFGAMTGMAFVMILGAIIGPQRAMGAPIGVLLYLVLFIFVWRRMKAKVRAPSS
jgi:hypothetical protein